MTERLRVTVYDGKYTVVQAEGGGLRALRYGEEWRDCTGDGLILALAQEVAELREALDKLVAARATIAAASPPPDIKALLTIRHMELMRHALGLPNKEKAPCRNHFVTGPGSDDYDDWQNLVGLGVATRAEGSALTGGDYLFKVAEAGISAVLLPGERREVPKRRRVFR